MNFGKMLSLLSPSAGMLSGNGAGFLPYLSPGFGMLSGKGPFGKILGGGHDQQPQEQPSAPPTGMFGAPSPGLGGYPQNQPGQQQQMGMDPMMLRYMMMQRGGY
jgi:hypothetical protein